MIASVGQHARAAAVEYPLILILVVPVRRTVGTTVRYNGGSEGRRSIVRIMNDEVERLLAAQHPQIAELARRLCALSLEVYPDAVVTVDGGDIGFGSGTGYKGLVFVVAPHSKHVTLGLFGGANLPDPAGLMEGTGKVHRHVKVRQLSDLERPELHQLMTAVLERQR